MFQTPLVAFARYKNDTWSTCLKEGCGVLVDVSILISAIVGLKLPMDYCLIQHSIDAGVGGARVASSLRGLFLSPVAGPEKWLHTCNHSRNAVNPTSSPPKAPPPEVLPPVPHCSIL